MLFSRWVRTISLSLALFSLSAASVEGEPPAKTAQTPKVEKSVRRPLAHLFDKRPVIEWNNLTPEEIDEWFDDPHVTTVLSIPEGSGFSIQLKIISDVFTMTDSSSEATTLRLLAKKKMLLTKRGPVLWMKLGKASWIKSETLLKRIIENSERNPLNKQGWTHDEHGPVFYFQAVLDSGTTPPPAPTAKSDEP